MKKYLFGLLILYGFFCYGSVDLRFEGTKAFMPQINEAFAYASYGSKIYVFGGFNFDKERNFNFIYDVSNDKWNEGTPLSVARFYSTASEINGKIYIFGGAKIVNGSVFSLKNVDIYDVNSNTMTPTTDLPIALRGASSVSANGKIYILGGKTDTGYSNIVYEFNPSTTSFVQFTTAPFASAYGGAVFDSVSNKVYYFGGLISDNPSPSSYLPKVYSLNLSSKNWEEVTTIPFKISNFAIAYDNSERKAYLIGGLWYDPTTMDEIPFYDIMVFSVESESFSVGSLPFMPSPLSRYNNGAVYLNGNLYLIGGNGILTVDVYSKATNSFLQTYEEIPNQNIVSPVSAQHNGKFYVIDGCFSQCDGKVYEYDLSLNKWTEKNGIDPTPRFYASSGYYNGKLYIVGGMNQSGALLSNVVAYDFTADAFTTLNGNDPYPTILAASAVHNGRIYIFGGRTIPSNPNSLTKKVRIYDVLTQSFSEGPDLPFEIEEASAITLNDKIYIFGGTTLSGIPNINKKVIMFDPLTSNFTIGVDIPYPVYGSSVATSGNFAFIDSGIHQFYSSNLSQVSSFPLPMVQVYDSINSNFYTFMRPYGRVRHTSQIIGSKILTTGGDDLFWPSTRLDVCSFTISTCSIECSATTETSTNDPLTINFKSNVKLNGCSSDPQYNWDFGDGTTSTEQNPTHTYQSKGVYNYTLNVSVDGSTCSFTGTVYVGVCNIECQAIVSPESGVAPLSVSFKAEATLNGCQSEPSYHWDFGDGTTFEGKETTHIYEKEGKYVYTLKVSADDFRCEKSGTITVYPATGCRLSCTATANPTSGNPPLTVQFNSVVSAEGCSQTPKIGWDFGDGTTSSEQNPVHTYVREGTYNWRFTVVADGQTCSQSGVINVTLPSQPIITSVTKLTSPFRLKVYGNGFKEGAKVLIEGVEVPSTKYKSSNLLIAKKGASLKTMVPKGVPVRVIVKNPDGSVSNEYVFVR